MFKPRRNEEHEENRKRSAPNHRSRSSFLRGLRQGITDVEFPETRLGKMGQKHKTNKPRVLHLITSFEVGGTERQAVELLKRIDRRRFDVRLAAVRLEGPLYREVAPLF